MDIKIIIKCYVGYQNISTNFMIYTNSAKIILQCTKYKCKCNIIIIKIRNCIGILY